MKNTIDLTSGHEIKNIIRYSLPLLWGNILQQLYFIINGSLVGNFLGKNALATIGVTYPIIFFLVSFLIGLTIGLSIIVAQFYGVKNFKKIQETTYTSLLFLFIFSLILAFFGFVLSRPTLLILGTPPEIIHDANLYFQLFAVSLPIVFLFNSINAILRGIGDSKTSFQFLALQVILNLFFDVIFILFLRIPVYYLALSILFSNLISLMITLLYLNKHHSILNKEIFSFSFNWEIFRTNLKIGIPSGLQQSFIALGNIALLHLINSYGAAATAAYFITSRIEYLISIPSIVLSSGLSIFVAQNGAIQFFKRIRKGYIGILFISFAFALTLSALCYFFRREIVMFFNADNQVVLYGSLYFSIAALFYWIFYAIFVNTAVLRGAGDTLTPMFVTMISLWLGRIPFAYILNHSSGVVGIWWSIPLGWVLGFLISSYYVWRRKWKKKFIVHSPRVS